MLGKAWGYVIALILGASLGWVGQQFWLPQVDRASLASGEQAFHRNEERIKQLREVGLSHNKISANARNSSDQNSKIIPKLIKDGRIDAAAQLILDDGDRYAQDLSLSKMVARRFIDDNEYEKALVFLYEQRLYVEPEIEQDLMQLIFQLVEQVDAKLGELSQLSLLVEFYRMLVSLHADHSPYYLRLTHWLIASGEIYQAEQSLAGALNDINYQESIAELEQRIELYASTEELIVIPLTMQGEHYVVELTGAGLDGLKLMLDTGASMTVLKASVAESLLPDALESATPLNLSTANGNVSGSKVLLPVVQMHDVIIENVEIGIMELPNFQYDGLLGMNILNRFRFYIDQENNELILKGYDQS